MSAPSTRPMPRWFVVIVFAIAMAWVESSVVFYLRTFIDRLEPYQARPLPLIGGFGPVELVRELATLVMLFTVGLLAGHTRRARCGAMLIAFGVWDIFYYLFLKVMCGWPDSLLDWDLLFLLPLPWWGPVLAPVMIALLMIAWGTCAMFLVPSLGGSQLPWRRWSCCVIGSMLALLVFMSDTLRVAAQGLAAVREVLPTRFNWPLFTVALILMSVPLVAELRLHRERKSVPAQP